MTTSERDFAERPTDFANIGLSPTDANRAVMSVMGEGTLDVALTGLTQPLMRLWLEIIAEDYNQFVEDYTANDSIGGIRYDEAARRVGHVVLAHYEAHPGDYFVNEDRLWQMLRKPLVGLLPLDAVTVFQWGWGINAARYVLGFEEMPNPALHVVAGKPVFVSMTRLEMDEIFP